MINIYIHISMPLSCYPRSRGTFTNDDTYANLVLWIYCTWHHMLSRIMGSFVRFSISKSAVLFSGSLTLRERVPPVRYRITSCKCVDNNLSGCYRMIVPDSIVAVHHPNIRTCRHPFHSLLPREVSIIADCLMTIIMCGKSIW